MYEDLIKRLRNAAQWADKGLVITPSVCLDAANAIEELSARVDSLKFFADNISKLPDCNTCLKKTTCEFLPKYGEYCRINCPAWLGVPETPKEGET